MNNLVSAVFDNREEARRAVTELRNAGIPDEAISLLGPPDNDDEIHEDEDEASKGSVAGAVAGGGVAGAQRAGGRGVSVDARVAAGRVTGGLRRPQSGAAKTVGGP